MEVHISTGKEFIKDYFDLLERFYKGNPAFDYYKSDTLRGIEYCFASEERKVFFIEVVSNSRVLGHIALILDKNFPARQGFFGFFECIEDKAVFRKLWNELLMLARKEKVCSLFGPVNGSIWHPYRVISLYSQEGYYPSEPLSQFFYYNWLKQLNPAKEIVYQSALRTDFSNIIKHTGIDFANITNSGINIEKQLDITPEIINQLFNLSSAIFKGSHGFAQLSRNDFRSLYSNEKLSNYLGSLYLARKNDAILGFCTNLKYKNTLMMKTIAVDPGYQLQGIGNALVYKIHLDALQSNTEKMVYALIRKDNNIKYFPTDDVKVFREYAAFEYIL